MDAGIGRLIEWLAEVLSDPPAFVMGAFAQSSLGGLPMKPALPKLIPSRAATLVSLRKLNVRYLRVKP